MATTDISTEQTTGHHHPSFLLGVAESGIDNVIAFAPDLGDESRQMLIELRARLDGAIPDATAGIARGRRFLRDERHTDLETFRAAVRS